MDRPGHAPEGTRQTRTDEASAELVFAGQQQGGNVEGKLPERRLDTARATMRDWPGQTQAYGS